MSDQKKSAAAAQAQKMVTELKVSGNVMTLDTGLFCIFNAPGSVLPDPGTGLPGVRISVPPGPVFRPEAVTISSFRDDGWLGGWNGAALVRVTRGPAQVLVTIYQAPNSTGEAPKLQILRLADASSLPSLAAPQGAPKGAQVATPAQAAAPAALAKPAAAPLPAAPAAGAASSPQNTPAGAIQADAEAVKTAEIVAHIAGGGDTLARLGEWMGKPGSKNWIEGFAVSPKGPVGPGEVEYQAVLGRGWLSPWAEGGQFCGSRGMSLPILGLRMRLRGEAAERFDCVVEASFVDGTRVGPLDNGEPCQAESMSPLEAFNIKLVPRGTAEPAPKAKPGKAATATAAQVSAKPQPAKPAASKPAPKAPAPAKAVAKPAKPPARGKR